VSKACLSCGTVNTNNAKYCSGCGKLLAGTSPNMVRGQVNRSGATEFCTKCRKQVRVLGNYTKYCEPDSPVELDLVEWEFRALECKHDKRIRKTGRTKNDLTSI
jgi:hypothetical protein